LKSRIEGEPEHLKFRIIMVRVGDRLEIPWYSGMTVGELLDRVPEGRECAAVRVNGRIVARPNFHHTPVPEGAQVHLVPMIAGG